MAFVNEYISEEDIERYEIEKLWLRYNPVYKGKEKALGFRHSWTIDKERDIYFMVLTGPDRDERYETCILNLRGRKVIVDLRGTEGGSLKLSDTPFVVVLELRGAIAYDLDDLEILKEALTAYGYSGIRRQIPNTIVKFKF